jgi:hypothetical protein
MKALLCKDCNRCKIAFPLCAKLAQNISFIMPLAHAFMFFLQVEELLPSGGNM